MQILAASESIRSALPDPNADNGTAPPTSPSLQHLLSHPTSHGSDIPLTRTVASLLAKLWSPTSDPKKPVNAAVLHRLLGKKRDEYDGSTQQDAHELLLCLLDEIRLEEVDLIKAINPPPPPSSTAASGGTKAAPIRKKRRRRSTMVPFKPAGQPALLHIDNYLLLRTCIQAR